MDRRTEEQTDRGKTAYPPPPSGSRGIAIQTKHESFHKQLKAKTNQTSLHAEIVVEITTRNSEHKDTRQDKMTDITMHKHFF